MEDNSITDKQLDDMIEDLESTDYPNLDESSQIEGYLHNHSIDIQESKPVSRLTVRELKYIIREIVREEVSYRNTPHYVPYTQPFYVTPNTYEQPWWQGPTCKAETTAQPLNKKEQIND